jgi:hypothetical protein
MSRTTIYMHGTAILDTGEILPSIYAKNTTNMKVKAFIIFTLGECILLHV